jgi:hypothetical protein
MSACETNQPDISDATDQPINISMFEPISLEMDSGAHSMHGSARTSLTYQDIVRERDRRKGNASPTSIDPINSGTGVRVPTDVVLGTGLLGSSQDIAHSLLLQVFEYFHRNIINISFFMTFEVLIAVTMDLRGFRIPLLKSITSFLPDCLITG